MNMAPFAEMGGSLVSSAAGFISAERQMKFQEKMASTQHQREVADLRAAGLNPILSGMGGSGSAAPSGAMYTPDNPARGLTAAIMLSKQTAANVAQIGENMKTMVTQQALNSAAAAREVATAKLTEQNVLKAFQETKHEFERRLLTSALTKKTKKEAGILSTEKILKDYEIPRSKAESEVYGGWGEKIPLIERILRIITGTGNIKIPQKRW